MNEETSLFIFVIIYLRVYKRIEQLKWLHLAQDFFILLEKLLQSVIFNNNKSNKISDSDDNQIKF